MFVNNEILEQVNELLHLPATSQEQDWAVELADRSRVKEFIAILKTETLSYEFKYAIMDLIIASFDNHLDYKGNADHDTWNDIAQLLDDKNMDYRDLIYVWALVDDTDESDLFSITPYLRRYVQERGIVFEKNW